MLALSFGVQNFWVVSLKNFAGGSTTITQVSSTDYREKLTDTAAKKPRNGEISFPNSSFCLLTCGASASSFFLQPSPGFCYFPRFDSLMDDPSKLEADLWEAADNLRANSKLTSSDYFMPVLGVIFLRHAANRFEAASKQIEEDQASRRMPKRKIAVYGSYNSPNIVAQRGTFTIFGQSTRPMEIIFDKEGFPEQSLVKLTILPSVVPGLRRAILEHGVTESVMFPDLSGLAREIRRSFNF
jgi:HsdM-like protein